MAEHIRPGLVRVDENALVDVRDRVHRARHEVSELALVLVRRHQRFVERAFEAERAQLAFGDAAQALGLPEGHEILRAREQRVCDVGFLGRFAHDDQRHHVGGLLPDLRDLADGGWQAVGEEAEELCVVIVECARERIDLCDPVAAHRMPTVTQ